jgi:hypothetical protein
MAPKKTVAQISGRVGGLRHAAMYDMHAFGALGQSTFRQSFDRGHGCQVCPFIEIPDDLPAAERRRRAEALYSAHFQALSLKSARARKRHR